MRRAKPIDSARTTSSGVTTTIRALRADDLEAVVTLWADNAREHFGEVLSYDRWGPGVPVLYDDDLVEVNVMTVDPLEAVRSQLAARLDHPAAFCLLAEHDGVPVGFVTASLLPASALDETTQVGAIEQLHVHSDHRRQRIGTWLVAAATDQLRRHGAAVIRAHVAPELTGALRFWDRQPHWTHDAHAYHSYD